MSSVKPITQRDVTKQVQSIVEGHTPATYGITPTNPTFACHGQNADLTENITPETVKKRIPGKLDNQESTVVKLSNLVNYKGFLMEADKSLLKWFAALPNGSGTPDDSRTFVKAYKLSDGIEYIRQYKGCKVESANITTNRDGYLMIDATLSFKTKTVDTAGPTLGSGSYGTPLVGTPLTHKDSTTSQVTYNGSAITISDLSISVSFTYADQDSLGSLVPLYREISTREISGSITVMKKDETLQNNAVNQTPKDLIWTLKSGFLITLARLRFTPSGEEMLGDNSMAIYESKSWDADELSIS